MRALVAPLLVLLVATPAAAAPAGAATMDGPQGFVCDDDLVGPLACGPGRAVCAVVTRPQPGPLRPLLVIACSLLFGYCPPDVFCV